MKHFQSGNNEQEYDGLFSKWKDSMDVQPVSCAEPIVEAGNKIYNQAIDDAVILVRQQYVVQGLMPDHPAIVLLKDLEKRVENLKK